MRLSADILTLLICLLFLPLSALGGAPVLLGQEGGSYPIGRHLEILEDPHQQWTIRDVSSSQLSRRFTPAKSDMPAFGFTRSAYWVRFSVRNSSDDTQNWLLELNNPIMDLAELYLPRADGGFEVRRSGRLLPFAQREVAHRDQVFRLPIGPGEEKTFYLRAASESLMYFSLKIWRQELFASKDRKEYLLLGIFYGVILVMVLYNLFLYVSLRDRAYLHYTLYAACYGITLFIVDGLPLQYLWPDAPHWNQKAEMGFAFLGLFWAVAFSRGFLRTGTLSPRLDGYLAMVQWSNGLCIPVAACLGYFHTVKILSLQATVLVFSLIAGAIISLRSGFRPARYFLFAWSWTLSGFLLLVLNDFIFHWDFILVLKFSQVCFAIELVLLSLALADRISALQVEKARFFEENTLLLEDNIRQQREQMERERRFFREKGQMLRDLHDGVGGITTNIGLLAGMAQRSTTIKETRKVLDTISSLSQESIGEIRSFMQSLDTRELNWEGLMSEMMSHGYGITEPRDMVFVFPEPVIPPAAPLPCSVLYLNLLRIYKEALTNIAKHSGALNVTVCMSLERDAVTLRIRDDGVGLPPAPSKGRGLGHMKARTEELGGDFKIVSEAGTLIDIVIPLPVKYHELGMDSGEGS